MDFIEQNAVEKVEEDIVESVIEEVVENKIEEIGKKEKSYEELADKLKKYRLNNSSPLP